MAGSRGKKGSFPMGRANRANKGARPVTHAQFQQMLNARREIKYITLNDESTCPANGVVFDLSQRILPGDNADQRNATQIQLTKIMIRLQLYLHPSAALDFVRFVLFMDTEAHGTYPTVAEVLVTADPNSHFTRGVHITKRFHILKDMCVPLTSTGSSLAVVRDFVVPCRKTITYQGTADAEVSNAKNALYILIVGDQTTNLSSYNVDTGIFYTDS